MELLDYQSHGVYSGGSIFAKVLPKSITADRKAFLSSLTRVNRLRNRIMHPIREYVVKEEDFYLIDNIYSMIVDDYMSHRNGRSIPDRVQLDVE